MAGQGSLVQVEDAASRWIGQVCDFMMQILVVILSVTVGYFVGLASKKPATATLQPAPLVQQATEPLEPFFIETEEMTEKALRARLKDMQFGNSGNKEDLVRRFDAALGGRRLVIAVHPHPRQ